MINRDYIIAQLAIITALNTTHNYKTDRANYDKVVTPIIEEFLTYIKEYCLGTALPTKAMYKRYYPKIGKNDLLTIPEEVVPIELMSKLLKLGNGAPSVVLSNKVFLAFSTRYAETIRTTYN